LTTLAERGHASAPEVLTLLIRARRGILRFAAGVAVLVSAIVLLLPRWWRAEGSFVAQTTRLYRDLGALSGVASQFGIALPGGDASYPPQFYASLMRSREILGQLVERPLDQVSDKSTRPRTLVDLLGEGGETPEMRRDRALRRLNEDMLGTAVDLRSGLVSFSIRSRNPTVSTILAKELLNAVIRFNEERRQSQAGAERRFTQQRLAEVRGELREAEDRLATFLQRNRDYRNSPTLTFEFDRLSREVTLRQQIFMALSQAHEQARIEEVRDTPVLTVVDAPSEPATPEPRRLLLKALLALVGALGLGAAAVLSRAALGLGTPSSPTTAAELSTLFSEAMRDLRRPWRLLLS
jgi:uncharacterized protein involved in exopolysaccharide biosynthesis